MKLEWPKFNRFIRLYMTTFFFASTLVMLALINMEEIPIFLEEGNSIKETIIFYTIYNLICVGVFFGMYYLLLRRLLNWSDRVFADNLKEGGEA
ncbi:MAG: hypothetical protein KKE20_05570 [Nanoarchaeota archaeon]|nr:hypothetical protein [Nanoarchaeota archaeon]